MTVWIHSPFDNLPHEGFRTQRYWLMAEAFAADGHTVVYWTSDFNHGTKARRKVTREIDSPVVLRLIPTCAYAKNVSLKRALSHLLYARKLRAALVGKPDLIVSATPMLGAAAVLLTYAREVGAKFVLDIQDAWPETFIRLGLPSFLLWPMFRLARKLYRSADLVTGVSERYRSICAREDYRVFYHGILPSASPSSSPSSSTFTLLYLGNLGAGYDLSTVLDVVAEDETLSLDIAGKGPREEALKAEVHARHLDSRVRFHGYLPETKLRELAARCSVGVIPMRDDSWVGLPYKLGDYLAASLPVVSSLHGECAELLRRERVGAVYDSGSSDSLRAALKALPSGPISLPEILRADRIYPAYVAWVKEACV